MYLLSKMCRPAVSAMAMLFMVACAGTPVTQSLTSSPPPGLPAAVELADVPFFAQTEYYCGPAALATMLNESGLDTRPEKLAKAIYTPGREGTLQTEIVSGARRNGRLALPVQSMTNALVEVGDGRPVLVFQNLGLDVAPQWHYAVLVGYDLDAGRAVLRSGTERRHVIDLETLEHTWRRTGFWGVVVAPPAGPVPGTTNMSSWLKEAYGLELTGHHDLALTAYRTAAARWPDKAVPLISLANVLIAQDRSFEATRALREALARQQDNAVAMNNLAHVLMRREKWDEAEEMALAAAAAGGETEKAAKQTLEEIRERREE